MHPLCETLNAQQQQAAGHLRGPLLILAGAGAGKTRVITYRILNLIHGGVRPEEILAVTFTNKAAKEMRERVGALLTCDELLRRSTSGALPFVATFHSLGVRIIKENAPLLGLTRHFGIYDRGDSVKAVKDAIVSLGLDPKRFEPRKILGIISRQKGNGVTMRAYRDAAGNEYMPRIASSVWERYEAALTRDRACDFDDLLLKAMTLLREHPDVLARYRTHWKYLHIDEYQDTNAVQYELARLLVGPERNICVVGDIDQNIYSWRGADLEHMLNFERDYTDATAIVLTKNYRSTKIIVAASNEIIKKNLRRKEKVVVTDNEEGEKISLYGAYDEADEGRFIAQKARELMRQGIEPRSIAVLYRANFQSRTLEEAFLRAGMPYQVLGVRFFERKEIKDVLALIRASLNPESVADLARAVNVPPRGIGKVTLLAMASKKTAELGSAARRKVAAFYAMLDEIREKADVYTPSDLVKFTIMRSGLEETLKKGGEDDLERLENIRELVTLAKKYEGLPAPEGLETFLEEAALSSDQDELKEEQNAAKLMTVHASKGLEFSYVFIAGLEEGLFPHERLSDDGVDTEEERRLFYVALTRAKKKVFLSFASLRTIYGAQRVNIPSQFITDLDEAFLEVEEVVSFGERERTIYLEE